MNDNYFELGGDSIRSIAILSRAQQSGLKLSLQQMFQHPMVAALAACAEASGQSSELEQTQPFSLISAEDRAKLLADPNTICRKQVEEMSDYYINTLRSMASDPNARYETFSPVSEAEAKRTLVEWNATAEEYPRN